MNDEDARISEIKKKLKPMAYTTEETKRYNRQQAAGFWLPILGIGVVILAFFNYELLDYFYRNYEWFFNHPDKILPFIELWWEHGMQYFK